MFSVSEKKAISVRTLFFLSFMILFFGITGYLTYYSKIIYTKNLPIVNGVMPERTEQNENGRFSYLVPADSIHVDTFHRAYILTARHISDIMGERHLATKIDIWVLERKEDGRVLIDGIVQEEPVLVGTKEEITDGTAIKLE